MSTAAACRRRQSVEVKLVGMQCCTSSHLAGPSSRTLVQHSQRARCARGKETGAPAAASSFLVVAPEVCAVVVQTGELLSTCELRSNESEPALPRGPTNPSRRGEREHGQGRSPTAARATRCCRRTRAPGRINRSRHPPQRINRGSSLQWGAPSSFRATRSSSFFSRTSPANSVRPCRDPVAWPRRIRWRGDARTPPPQMGGHGVAGAKRLAGRGDEGGGGGNAGVRQGFGWGRRQR
ncbi:hypothetical protein C2845_PM03G32920 [Panicum miliaceum]|uniref:Uncharacterized protein n=1 Tax=Panicum miliaceum TaxID=4540 RepID=A0A3L6T5K9_PANMI|nr:hypothetical protein C2845_PM03G32920 [Panicum miliaceum]